MTTAEEPAGSTGWFEILYQEHLPAVMAYALRRCASPEDAADVVAEVFLVAWRRPAEVPAAPAARLWLFGTARRIVANHHRGDARRQRLGAELAKDLRTAAEHTQLGTGPDAVAIHEGLGRLSTTDRELLLLVAGDGLNPREAATILGITATAARVRLHRARTRLRGLIDQPSTASDPPQQNPAPPDVAAPPEQSPSVRQQGARQ